MSRTLPALALILALTSAAPTSQGAGAEPTTIALPDRPQILRDSMGQPFQIVPIKGLHVPWALAFLPNGDMLVTEIAGRLRIIRNGVLDPEPIADVPEVDAHVLNGGLMDVAVHPLYSDNKFIYLTYSKGKAGNPFGDLQWTGTEHKPGGKRNVGTVALARARFDGGHRLTDVQDIFVSDAWAQGTSAGRLVFARDGTIILAIGMATRHAIGVADDAQNPKNDAGKILRLNDDGTVPKDNPFVGKPGYRPEIYALGIRNALGLFVHPETGEIWETENGPMGGDEINIIRPGRNYGWPIISYGMDYSGVQVGGASGTTSPDRKRAGLEEPFYYWHPSPAMAGIIVYTGDKFPTWKGNIFIGALGGSNFGGRQLHRIALSPAKLQQRAGEMTMLYELKQRIRDVKQGPDGSIYLTTDESDGAVIRIEPAQIPNDAR